MGKVDSTADKYYNMSNLEELMDALRGEGGCPWDRAQTHESLKPHLIEEAYEVLEALEEENDPLLQEELGDLLLQVLFHSTIAKEQGRFQLKDVMQGLGEKIVFRHPHVFKDRTADSEGEASASWEDQKRKEKNITSTTESMKRIPKHLPALMRADKIQGKARQVGFDWEDPKEVILKVQEELGELLEAHEEGNRKKIQEEGGDLLFSVVNLLRFFDVEPEGALNRTTDKFIRRFDSVEQDAEKGGKPMKYMDLKDLEKLWQQAKRKKG
ncbi:nucleoside triphosphate pyrophosphohydrolase [Isachenkonia alkalipeptolytica]|nr:nucleoside triphosphate pyrophosphohydrolase [Isachenkonia alkalipeptolytica]